MEFNPDIFARYFKGDYSKKDYKEIKSVFENPKFRIALKQHLLEHWNTYFDKPVATENIDHLLHKIHAQIQSDKKATQVQRFLIGFQRVAAILIFPLLLAFFAYFLISHSKTEAIQNPAFAEIQCPLGVRTKFELPDGSSGFLNSGSRLRYPVSFSNERDVSVYGEAFFDVAHDSKHPFVVSTQNLKIKVVGTCFNVIAYDEDPMEEIILNKGKVEVLSKDNKLVETLLPNQSLILDKEKHLIRKKTVEATQYIGWTEGKLIFRNENMKQVTERLGRWYNAEIVAQDPEILDFAFRATFIDEPLDEVLKLLTLTAPITFEELPRETTNDNTYKKRKVILKLDKKRQAAFK